MFWTKPPKPRVTVYKEPPIEKKKIYSEEFKVLQDFIKSADCSKEMLHSYGMYPPNVEYKAKRYPIKVTVGDEQATYTKGSRIVDFPLKGHELSKLKELIAFRAIEQQKEAQRKRVEILARARKEALDELQHISITEELNERT